LDHAEKSFLLTNQEIYLANLDSPDVFSPIILLFFFQNNLGFFLELFDL
jgi:hypothetical protein